MQSASSMVMFHSPDPGVLRVRLIANKPREIIAVPAEPPSLDGACCEKVPSTPLQKVF